MNFLKCSKSYNSRANIGKCPVVIWVMSESSQACLSLVKNYGTPGASRTHDTRFRKPSRNFECFFDFLASAFCPRFTQLACQSPDQLRDNFKGKFGNIQYKLG